MKFVGLAIPKIWLIISHGVNRPGDLDLLNSKWGHGSPVSWASFLPISSFLSSSVLDLGSGMEQTDKQTDGDTQTTVINALCPTLQGRGHKSLIMSVKRRTSLRCCFTSSSELSSSNDVSSSIYSAIVSSVAHSIPRSFSLPCCSSPKNLYPHSPPLRPQTSALWASYIHPVCPGPHKIIHLSQSSHCVMLHCNGENL